MSSASTGAGKRKRASQRSPAPAAVPVDHTYRDYSLVAARDLLEDDAAVLPEDEYRFPSKLHRILSTPAYARIIAWRPHGRAWAVLDRPRFIQVVVPEHFDTRHYESFNRSVNGWGFKRLWRDGPDQGAYYHELFLRGREDLTSVMTRPLGTGRRPPNPSGEPDFYVISREYPLPDPSHVERANPPRQQALPPTLALTEMNAFQPPLPHPIGHCPHVHGPPAYLPHPQHLRYVQPPSYTQPSPSYAQHYDHPHPCLSAYHVQHYDYSYSHPSTQSAGSQHTMLHYPNPQNAANMPRQERHPWLPHGQPSRSPMAHESLGYYEEQRPERTAADEGSATATHLNNLLILHAPPDQRLPLPPKRHRSHPPGNDAGLGYHEKGRRERRPYDEDGKAATNRKGHVPPSDGPPFLSHQHYSQRPEGHDGPGHYEAWRPEQHRSEEGSRAATNQSVSAMIPQPQLLHPYHAQIPRGHDDLYEETRLAKNLTDEGGRATISQNDPAAMPLRDWRTSPVHQYYPQTPRDHDGLGRYGEQRPEQNSFYERGKAAAMWKRQAITPLEKGRPSPPHHGPGHDEQERPEQNLNNDGGKVAASWIDQVSMPPDTGHPSPPRQFHSNLPRRHDRPGQYEARKVDRDQIYEDSIARAKIPSSQMKSSHDSRKVPGLAPPNKDATGEWGRAAET